MHYLFDSHTVVLLITVDVMGKSICYIILNSTVKFKLSLTFLIMRKDAVSLSTGFRRSYMHFIGYVGTEKLLWCIYILI